MARLRSACRAAAPASQSLRRSSRRMARTRRPRRKPWPETRRSASRWQTARRASAPSTGRAARMSPSRSRRAPAPRTSRSGPRLREALPFPCPRSRRALPYRGTTPRIRLLALTSAAICRLLAVPAPAAAGITAANATVGRSLEADATVRLTPVSAEPVTLTLTSDDPARLLLSTAPDRPGSAQISLKIQARFPESPDFWLQGLADSGTVTYTVSAEGLGSAKGTVTLARSAVVILGPLKAPKFTITPHGLPARLTLVSVAIDGDGKVAKEQPVAGGSQIEVALSSSNRGVGNLRASTLTIAGGTSTAMTAFEPAGEGETVITPVEPRGFTA